MTRPLVFAYPGNLGTPTGGYGYDRRLISGLSDLGWPVTPLSLGPGFPIPDANQLRLAEEKLDLLEPGSLVIVDGLAYGVMEDWASRQAKNLDIVALVHHPLAMETGISADDARRLVAGETLALSHAASVIVTSPATAALLAHTYCVPKEKILIAVPGIDPVPLARGTRQPPLILSIGSLTRRKGHDILLSALEQLADLSWTCRIVGSEKLDPETAASLKKQLSDSPVGERIDLVGEVGDVKTEFSKADIFALATRYEGYGMVFAEALAHGLPIVGCKVGAVPEVVPRDVGMLVEPDDPDQFAAALRSLLADEALRARLANRSAVASRSLPSWQDTALLVSEFLQARHGL